MNRCIVIVLATLFFSASCRHGASDLLSNTGMNNYVPFAVGNTWIYDSEYSYQAVDQVTITKGEESWKIISCKDDASGKLQGEFKGSRYHLQWGQVDWDTVAIVPLQIMKEYLFSMKVWSFTISQNDTAKMVTLDMLEGYMRDGGLVTCFPPDSPAEIERSWFVGADSRSPREYTIERNIGIKKFVASDSYIFGGNYLSYSLKKFTERTGAAITLEE